MDEPLGLLERKIRREAVRYAVQRAIFCPECDKVLDVRNAVLVDTGNRVGIFCGGCFDATIEKAKQQHGITTEEVLDILGEVDDGRKLR